MDETLIIKTVTVDSKLKFILCKIPEIQDQNNESLNTFGNLNFFVPLNLVENFLKKLC